MPDREAIAMRATRLRWRLRGAWQWPTFAAATVADAVLLAELPVAGTGAGVFPMFLLAGFLNLIMVAAVAPLAGRVLRRRRPGLPREIATDYGGTGALVALLVVLLAGGLVHRPAVADARRTQREAVAAAQAYVAHRGPAAYQAGLALPDTWRQSAQLFRTCFPGPDPHRHLCVIVRMGEGAPIVRRDPDQSPNSVLAGPDNPGRLTR